MNKFSAKWLLTAGIILSFLIAYSYAFTTRYIYGGIELILAAACYFFVFLRLRNLDNISSRLILILCSFSLINGIIAQDLKSVVLLSISLVLILAVSVVNVDCDGNGRDFAVAYLIGTLVIALLEAFSILEELNSNTKGFLYFMVFSFGMVWQKSSKNKIISTLCLIPGVYFCLFSGSRNVAVITAISLILLFLPKLFYSSKTFFRVTYIAVLLYTVFAPDIMSFGFSNTYIRSIIDGYTSYFSEKAWTIISRVEFYDMLKTKMESLPLYYQLFGEGVLTGHRHNMFYQAFFIYGAVGSIFLYFLFARIFEMAGRLIRERDDKVAMGLFIALIGMLLLNGADVFIVGSETCAVIPQVVMGVIMIRYRMAYPESYGEDSALPLLGEI